MYAVATPDPALVSASTQVTDSLSNNLPTILGVVATFVGASLLIGFIRGLRRNKV
jgi:hypothetical protein